VLLIRFLVHLSLFILVVVILSSVTLVFTAWNLVAVAVCLVFIFPCLWVFVGS